MAEALSQRELDRAKLMERLLESVLVRVLGLAMPTEDEATGVLKAPSLDSYIPASLLFAHPRVAEALHENLTAFFEQEKAVTAPAMTAEDVDKVFDQFDDVFEAGQTRAEFSDMQNRLQKAGVQMRTTPKSLPQEFLAHFSRQRAKQPEDGSGSMDAMELRREAAKVNLTDAQAVDALFDKIEASAKDPNKPHFSFKAGPRRPGRAMMTPEEAAAAGVMLSEPPPVVLTDDDVPGEPKAPRNPEE